MKGYLKMRTNRYGEIKEFKSLCSVDGFLSIPVQISRKDRWICHVMQSDPKGNGNWGSAILAFVDNYGEIYFFFEHSLGQPTHLSHYIRWNIDDNGGTTDKNIYAIINQGGLKCESKQELNFPLTDDFIDILKCYSRPDSAYSNAKKDIELFVKKLIETNKKIVGDYEKSFDESFNIIYTLQKKINEYEQKLKIFTNDEMPKENAEYHLFIKENSIPNKNIIINAVESRLQKERMRGFISEKSAKSFHSQLVQTKEKSEEDKRLEKISHSWAYDS